MTLSFAKTEEEFRNEIAVKLFVRRPRQSSTGWVVEIVEGSLSPLAKVRETIPCAGRTSADKTYNWAMKQLGYSY